MRINSCFILSSGCIFNRDFPNGFRPTTAVGLSDDSIADCEVGKRVLCSTARLFGRFQAKLSRLPACVEAFIADPHRPSPLPTPSGQWKGSQSERQSVGGRTQEPFQQGLCDDMFAVYGTEGYRFESCRACYRKPLPVRGSLSYPGPCSADRPSRLSSSSYRRRKARRRLCRASSAPFARCRTRSRAVCFGSWRRRSKFNGSLATWANAAGARYAPGLSEGAAEDDAQGNSMRHDRLVAPGDGRLFARSGDVHRCGACGNDSCGGR